MALSAPCMRTALPLRVAVQHAAAAAPARAPSPPEAPPPSFRRSVRQTYLIIIVLRLGGAIVAFLLAHGVEALDHVLHALVDLALVQHAAQPLEDRVEPLRRHLAQRVAALLHEADRDLDGVVRRLLEEEREELQRDDLVGDLLVD